jgi:crotonobetainyl-CoA:carnitine CoA-transferase CaiB-like acyl-CoA transferase
MAPDRSGPLSDIRVLDLGHVVAGPFAGTLLGDLGADVIKIEDPRRGDTIRTLSPRHEGVPLWWKVAGRNKRSLALDLREARGREILLRLVALADVLIENFRPGTLERWELGVDRLQEAQPNLIVLRISGFGQQSTFAERPGYGRIGEAMSGAVNLTGEPDGRPYHVGFSLGDATTGLMGALGVLAALHGRQRRNGGEVVDVALYESLFRMIEWQLPMAEKRGETIRRQGNRFPIGYAVAGSWQASDGRWLSISAATERSIQRLLGAVRGEDAPPDPRFADFEARSRPGHMELIDEAIGAWVASLPAEAVIDAFADSDVAVGLVYDAEMMLADPFFRERGSVIEVDDPELGTMSMPGVIPKLREDPGSVRWAGPRLGEHTDEVLAELLGYDDGEIDELRREGVVA